MLTPVNVCVLTAATMAVIILVYVIKAVSKSGKKHFIEIGQDKDLFWIPGDPTSEDDTEYNSIDD